MRLQEALGGLGVAAETLQAAVKSATTVVLRELARLLERRDGLRDARRRRRVIAEGTELLRTARGRLAAIRASLSAGLSGGSVQRDSEVLRLATRAEQRLVRGEVALEALHEEEEREKEGTIREGHRVTATAAAATRPELRSGDG